MLVLICELGAVNQGKGKEKGHRLNTQVRGGGATGDILGGKQPPPPPKPQTPQKTKTPPPPKKTTPQTPNTIHQHKKNNQGEGYVGGLFLCLVVDKKT